MTSLTIVSPAHNEAENLPLLYEQFGKVLDEAGLAWRWVVVDDCSSDDTFSVIEQLAAADGRVTGIRLARNFGSHLAIFCGLDFADGDCVVVMASDLEDPPGLLPSMVEAWRTGAKVVWAVREQRHDKGAAYKLFARLYYWFTRRILGVSGMPETGADFFLMDATIKDMLRQYRDKHISVFALVAWLSRTHVSIPFTKQARQSGTSSWTLRKQIKLVVDTMVGFSHFPIRVMSLAGASAALVGLVLAINVVANAFAGNPPQGWTSLMVVVLFLGGLQMVMLGMLGEYLWRTLEESRDRPRFLVEAVVGAPTGGDQASP